MIGQDAWSAHSLSSSNAKKWASLLPEETSYQCCNPLLGGHQRLPTKGDSFGGSRHINAWWCGIFQGVFGDLLGDFSAHSIGMFGGQLYCLGKVWDGSGLRLMPFQDWCKHDPAESANSSRSSLVFPSELRAKLTLGQHRSHFLQIRRVHLHPQRKTSNDRLRAEVGFVSPMVYRATISRMVQFEFTTLHYLDCYKQITFLQAGSLGMWRRSVRINMQLKPWKDCCTFALHCVFTCDCHWECNHNIYTDFDVSRSDKWSSCDY